jgi:secreted trypsin-like serine protease
MNGKRSGTGVARLAALALALLIVAGTAGWGAAAERAGTRRGPDAQVVGGQKVPDGWYRFVVALEQRDGKTWDHQCGGSMIDADWVLTAAHCVVGSDGTVDRAADWRAVIGVNDLKAAKKRHVRPVVEIRTPAGYNPKVLGTWDVALMRLAEPMAAPVADGVTIVALPAPNDGQYERPGQALIVAGWGQTLANDGTRPPAADLRKMRYAPVQVIADAECLAAGELYADVDPALNLCTYFPGKDACYGDRGGPIFVRYQATPEDQTVRYLQVGIVSWGLGCGWPGNPGVWTRLSNPDIQAWIVTETMTAGARR